MAGQRSEKPDSLRTLPPETLVPILQETLEQGSSFVLVVTGSSMLPTLCSRVDKVELVSPRVRPVRKGEIVFFRRSTGEYILHRVLRKEQDSLCINGDAQVWTENILSQQVIGVVNRFTRKGRWISCNSWGYRVYVAAWRLVKPLRPAIFRLRGLFG